jgi:predicted dithiol-disulfide oxidoreductase (DUF899 family)
MATSAMANPKVGTREQWLAARKELLIKEKELTRQRDAISAQLRELPWVGVDKEYVFDTPTGKKKLGDLFEGRSQLIVYHFMLGPDWKEGCVGCSFLVDHVGGVLMHLEQHDVKFTAVSRAPLAEIEAFKKRMGWNFSWVSSNGSDFNYDYHVSFTPEELESGKIYYNFESRDAQGGPEQAGISVFYKDENGNIFHTYSTYGRGGENFLTTYNYLDVTPRGRNEEKNLGDWVRHHDRYSAGGYVDATGRYHAEEKSECGCHANEAEA